MIYLYNIPTRNNTFTATEVPTSFSLSVILHNNLFGPVTFKTDLCSLDCTRVCLSRWGSVHQIDLTYASFSVSLLRSTWKEVQDSLCGKEIFKVLNKL